MAAKNRKPKTPAGTAINDEEAARRQQIVKQEGNIAVVTKCIGWLFIAMAFIDFFAQSDGEGNGASASHLSLVVAFQGHCKGCLLISAGLLVKSVAVTGGASLKAYDNCYVPAWRGRWLKLLQLSLVVYVGVGVVTRGAGGVRYEYVVGSATACAALVFFQRQASVGVGPPPADKQIPPKHSGYVPTLYRSALFFAGFGVMGVSVLTSGASILSVVVSFVSSGSWDPTMSLAGVVLGLTMVFISLFAELSSELVSAGTAVFAFVLLSWLSIFGSLMLEQGSVSALVGGLLSPATMASLGSSYLLFLGFTAVVVAHALMFCTSIGAGSTDASESGNPFYEYTCKWWDGVCKEYIGKPSSGFGDEN